MGACLEASAPLLNEAKPNKRNRTYCASKAASDQFVSCWTFISPRVDGQSYGPIITFEEGRQGYDQRYVVDAREIEKALGWGPKEAFENEIKRQ